MPQLDFPSNYAPDGKAEKLIPTALGELFGASADDLKETEEAYFVERDFIYTLSIMCSPESEIDAIRVINAKSLEELWKCICVLDDFGLDVQCSGALTREIAGREDASALFKILLETDKVAHLASGLILRWIVSRWQKEETRDQASLAKAAEVVEEWGRSHNITGTSRQNIIRNIWKKYSRVSHLLASFYLMKEACIDPCDHDGFLLFCSTAQWLLEQGSVIVPRGRRDGETILSVDQAWSVPPKFVRRNQEGSIMYLWNTNPEAHDIRNLYIGNMYTVFQQV